MLLAIVIRRSKYVQEETKERKGRVLRRRLFSCRYVFGRGDRQACAQRQTATTAENEIGFSREVEHLLEYRKNDGFSDARRTTHHHFDFLIFYDFITKN